MGQPWNSLTVFMEQVADDPDLNCAIVTGGSVGFDVRGTGGSFYLSVKRPGNAPYSAPGVPGNPAQLVAQTFEIWTDAPTTPGAVQLYSGPFDAIPASVPVTITRSGPLGTDLLYIVTADPIYNATPLVVTNWQICWDTTAPVIIPPTTPPSGTVIQSNYALRAGQTADPQTGVRLPDVFSWELGQVVGVTVAEMAWDALPMFVSDLEWHWASAPAPLAETLRVQIQLRGLPATNSSGGSTAFELGEGGAGLDFGALV